MTPFKKAIDNFTRSDEYRSSIEPSTIGATERQRQYLANRIHRAFTAGWNAAMVERRFSDTSAGESNVSR